MENQNQQPTSEMQSSSAMPPAPSPVAPIGPKQKPTWLIMALSIFGVAAATYAFYIAAVIFKLSPPVALFYGLIGVVLAGVGIEMWRLKFWAMLIYELLLLAVVAYSIYAAIVSGAYLVNGILIVLVIIFGLYLWSERALFRQK